MVVCVYSLPSQWTANEGWNNWRVLSPVELTVSGASVQFILIGTRSKPLMLADRNE